uniref:Uncharacterized protein n=1 Tax=Anas platyrhynchos platyrhynchos TaxID=8840 RepID=A0A493SYV8_ANAPP
SPSTQPAPSTLKLHRSVLCCWKPTLAGARGHRWGTGFGPPRVRAGRWPRLVVPRGWGSLVCVGKGSSSCAHGGLLKGRSAAKGSISLQALSTTTSLGTHWAPPAR